MEEKMGCGAEWITRLLVCLAYVSFLVWPFRHGYCGTHRTEAACGQCNTRFKTPDSLPLWGHQCATRLRGAVC